MDPKYSNIFFHQGVKVFENSVFESKQGQIKVAHLENDVTKALINLFQRCSSVVTNELIGEKFGLTYFFLPTAG